MAQVVLDELEGAAGVEQVGGDRVAQRVACEPPWEIRGVAIPREEGLDLALSERPPPPREERVVVAPVAPGQVPPEWAEDGGEDGALGPGAMLEPADDDSRADEVHVATAQKGHFADAQTVEVGQEKDQSVPRSADRGEEAAKLLLPEISRGIDGERHKGGT